MLPYRPIMSCCARNIGRSGLAISLLLCATTLLAQNSLTALKLPDFSATEIVNSRGNRVSTIKVYRSGINLRDEDGPGFATIFLPAHDEVYQLLERAHACIKMRLDQVSKIPSPLQLLIGSKVDSTHVGTEVVDRHTCKIENVVVTMPNGKTIKSKVWTADDLQGIPLKIETETENGPLTATFRDIVPGNPDAALFTPPAKCTPFEKMYTVVE